MGPLKRALLFTVILAILAGISGCEQPPQKKTGIKIGVCLYKQNDTFISAILSDFEGFAKEYEQSTGIKVNLDVSDAKEIQRVQNDQIKRLLSLNYDVLCVNIVDRTNAAPIIDAAIEAGIPLVFFNREPVESDIMRGEDIYYIGSDAKTTAVLQGEIIVDAYRESPGSIDKNGDGVIQYCMLEGEMGHQDAIIRTEWSVRTLEEHRIPMEKIYGGVANWDRNQAAALAEQWLGKNEGRDIDLIICNNDDMALGAADAMKKLRISDIAIVGIDATPQGREAVRQGTMIGTIDCHSEIQARQIFDLACSLGLYGRANEDAPIENERYIRIPLGKITRNNVDKLN